jgi:urease accessory protein
MSDRAFPLPPPLSLPLPLLVWLSPGFPIGAFAYSHGLEWAVESGGVRDAATLRDWLGDLVAAGSIRADAVILAATITAIAARDVEAAWEINALALALAPSRERLLETSAQGNAFLAAVGPAWPAPGLDLFIAMLAEGDCAYPVAVGAACAAHAISTRPALDAFTLAACANLVSAAVRLGPIGQTEAQAVIAALCPALGELAAFAAGSSLADVGTCAWGADIASMRHETQYSRLFRS